MKKTILLLALFAISICGFTQTVIAENGKAYQIVPEKKTELSKQDLLNKKQNLKTEISSIEREIVRLQDALVSKKEQLELCEDVCMELGYK